MRTKTFFAFFALLFASSYVIADGRSEGRDDPKRSAELFLETAKVYRHPRCINCHPAGSKPTQGMDMHPHVMNVVRGPKDHGAVAMQCTACHGVKNNEASGVPGAPKWAVAPLSMGWQGLNDRELCEAIKDKKKNHGMSLEQLVEHNAKDELVGWAWKPGAGREPAPGTQESFGKLVAEWVATGAHCPN
ncbi:MAG: Isoquinoline 1-oxidoreductase subunit [Proteobacteria bacterium]|nr:MAG: Isoquinoline 1-oxidoreductase subunit [Pseudomonadota bacterium]